MSDESKLSGLNTEATKKPEDVHIQTTPIKSDKHVVEGVNVDKIHEIDLDQGSIKDTIETSVKVALDFTPISFVRRNTRTPAAQLRQDVYTGASAYLSAKSTIGKQLESLVSRRNPTLKTAAQKRDAVDKFISERLQNSRLTEISDQNADILVTSKNILGFQTGPTSTYMKNSLELSYRQLFATKSLITLTKATAEMLENKLEAIKINTRLPDVVKPIGIIRRIRDAAVVEGAKTVGKAAATKALDLAATHVAPSVIKYLGSETRPDLKIGESIHGVGKSVEGIIRKSKFGNAAFDFFDQKARMVAGALEPAVAGATGYLQRFSERHKLAERFDTEALWKNTQKYRTGAASLLSSVAERQRTSGGTSKYEIEYRNIVKSNLQNISYRLDNIYDLLRAKFSGEPIRATPSRYPRRYTTFNSSTHDHLRDDGQPPKYPEQAPRNTPHVETPHSTDTHTGTGQGSSVVGDISEWAKGAWSGLRSAGRKARDLFTPTEGTTEKKESSPSQKKQKKESSLIGDISQTAGGIGSSLVGAGRLTGRAAGLYWKLLKATGGLVPGALGLAGMGVVGGAKLTGKAAMAAAPVVGTIGSAAIKGYWNLLKGTYGLVPGALGLAGKGAVGGAKLAGSAIGAAAPVVGALGSAAAKGYWNLMKAEGRAIGWAGKHAGRFVKHTGKQSVNNIASLLGVGPFFKSKDKEEGTLDHETGEETQGTHKGHKSKKQEFLSVTTRLDKIYNLLKERLPEPIRANSYQDHMKKLRERYGTGLPGKEGAKGAAVGGGILGTISSLLGRRRKEDDQKSSGGGVLGDVKEIAEVAVAETVGSRLLRGLGSGVKGAFSGIKSAGRLAGRLLTRRGSAILGAGAAAAAGLGASGAASAAGLGASGAAAGTAARTAGVAAAETTAAQAAGSMAAGATAAKAAGSVAASSGAKAIEKASVGDALRSGVKFFGKKIPILGTLLGAGFAAKSAYEGDWLGAAGELAAGIASNVPIAGTALSATIDTALTLRQMSRQSGNTVGRTDPFFKARLAAYGAKEINTDAIGALELRAYNLLEKKSGGPIHKEELHQIAKSFGFDPTNEKSVDYFLRWLRGRFQACFIVYLSFLKRNNLTIDQEIPSEKLAGLISEYNKEVSVIVTRFNKYEPSKQKFSEVADQLSGSIGPSGGSPTPGTVPNPPTASTTVSSTGTTGTPTAATPSAGAQQGTTPVTTPSAQSAGSLAAAGLLTTAGAGLSTTVGRRTLGAVSSKLAERVGSASAAGSTTARVVEKVAGRFRASETLKTGIKVLGKKIPVIGTLIGAGLAAKSAVEGDWLGAAGELVSGAFSNIPIVGTAISTAIDAAMIARKLNRQSGNVVGSPGVLLKARLIAYGAKEFNTTAIGKLELRAYRRITKQDDNRIENDELVSFAKEFGIDPKDEKAVEYFRRWMRDRFHLCFTIYLSVLSKSGHKLDDEIPEAEIPKILNEYNRLVAPVIDKFKDYEPSIHKFNAAADSLTGTMGPVERPQVPTRQAERQETSQRQSQHTQTPTSTTASRAYGAASEQSQPSPTVGASVTPITAAVAARRAPVTGTPPGTIQVGRNSTYQSLPTANPSARVAQTGILLFRPGGNGPSAQRADTANDNTAITGAPPSGASSSGSPASNAPAQGISGRSWDQKSVGIMSNLMKDFGLTKEQAAGIVGNLGHECGGLSEMQERNPVGGGRGGLGWAQWTGERRVAFESYCKQQGLDPFSDKANYGFLKKELSGEYRRAINAVKQTSDTKSSMMAFEKQYEAAGIKHYESRQQYADKALTVFDKSGGAAASAPSDATTTPSASAGVAAVNVAPNEVTGAPSSGAGTTPSTTTGASVTPSPSSGGVTGEPPSGGIPSAQAAATPSGDPTSGLPKGVVGTGQCVDLVKAATGLGQTSTWQRGPSVVGNPNIKPGTAIASFDSNGRYGNHEDGSSHAAIYLGPSKERPGGIRVYDQWSGQKAHIRDISASGSTAVNSARSYSIIKTSENPDGVIAKSIGGTPGASPNQSASDTTGGGGDDGQSSGGDSASSSDTGSSDGSASSAGQPPSQGSSGSGGGSQGAGVSAGGGSSSPQGGIPGQNINRGPSSRSPMGALLGMAQSAIPGPLKNILEPITEAAFGAQTSRRQTSQIDQQRPIINQPGASSQPQFQTHPDLLANSKATVSAIQQSISVLGRMHNTLQDLHTTMAGAHGPDGIFANMNNNLQTSNRQQGMIAPIINQIMAKPTDDKSSDDDGLDVSKKRDARYAI